MTYRSDLIQEAAEAIAKAWTDDVHQDVLAERDAEHLTPLELLDILGEDVGEACRAILETQQETAPESAPEPDDPRSGWITKQGAWFGKAPFTQQPIPWCIPHDDMAAGSGDRCRGFSFYGTKWDVNECIISTGGPDHKWWVDDLTEQDPDLK